MKSSLEIAQEAELVPIEMIAEACGLQPDEIEPYGRHKGKINLGVIERLKAEGMTIILVEQSLNVALSVSDRAVFLEKGQVRFEGPAAELAERDDLARAVFLGRDGG